MRKLAEYSLLFSRNSLPNCDWPSFFARHRAAFSIAMDIKDVLKSTKRYVDLVGDTPLVDLSSLLPESVKQRAGGCYLFGKAEFLNPGFSMKDRIIVKIFNQAEEEGKLKRGQVVVCASSGNTGAACAMLCAARGYKAVIITNDKCSKEKMNAIRSYGAQLRVAKPTQNYMTIELELSKEHPDWFSVNQYECHLNSAAHFTGTGTEIYEQTRGLITHFVAGASTGGTITGVGRYLKKQRPSTRVVLADPAGSIFNFMLSKKMTETEAAPHTKKFLVEGVGKRSVPGVFDLQVVDHVLEVTDKEAFQMCRRLACSEGLCVGGSSGMNVHAGVELAKQLVEFEGATGKSAGAPEPLQDVTPEAGDTLQPNQANEIVNFGPDDPVVIVTILSDSGLKYLSKIFNGDWLQENGVGDAS